MKKIVAVTGANGFIGSRLSSYLSDAGNEVRCIVRPTSDLSLLSSHLEIHRIDYDDKEALRDILTGSMIVIHAAALTRARHWDDFQKINIDLVADLVEVINQIDSIQQFIFISSQAASGPAKSGVGKQEDDPCHPVSMYGRSKLQAEEIVHTNCQKPWTIIRPASVFGEGEKDFYNYYKIIEKGIAPVVGIVDRFMSVIHVDDLCSILDSAMLNKSAYNQIFFAAANEDISMAGFAYLIAQSMQKKIFELRIPLPVLYLSAIISELFTLSSKAPPLLNREKYREMKQRYWLVSIKKSVDILNFSQTATLTRQMQQTIKWYKSQGLLK